jgi:hypothetical protein
VTLKDGRLTLKGVAPDTLYFSDRPDRIVGRTTTQAYVDHWSVGESSCRSYSQLSVVWTDPDFDSSQAAVYYVRVLEIPTPRWSTYDSVRSGIPVPDGVPTTLQERAWSSPIWYTPPKS